MCWFLAAVFLAAEQFFSGVCTVVSRVAAVDRAVVLAHPPRLTAARGQGGHQCYTVPRLPPPPFRKFIKMEHQGEGVPAGAANWQCRAR